jgi:uncharacterized protein
MVQVSYPGVYIQEVPSGVRTITGVATSVTAFIGRALSGPTDEPVTINSFPEYERRFGGLWSDSTMSYAVRDFYANQGSQAIIVRVAHTDARTATLQFGDSPAGDLVLEAASAGAWGNRLSATVNHDSDARLPRTSPPSTDPAHFNLLVEYQVAPDRQDVVQEPFLNVSLDESDPRYLPRVLESQSQLVRVQSHMTVASPPARPDAATAEGEGGTDGGNIDDADLLGNESARTGLYALNRADLFNLLCIPPPIRVSAENMGTTGTFTSANVYGRALTLCVLRRAFLIVDPDPQWGASVANAVANAIQGREDLSIAGTDARNAALYFPAIRAADPLRDDQVSDFVPCGAVAGIMARTDSARGVWKAPAGLDAALAGVQGLQINLTDQQNGQLNQLGINCLRSFPVNGRVVWGARTMRGADQAADEYKYVPVRRLALFIEESLYRGTQWVVFEPNDEPLWAQIRLNVGAFMQNLFRQGAFQGRSPREAYLVKCDAETTTQNDINLGIVNILVGFAPLKPAEFVIIRIQQLAGQVQA